MKILYLFIFPLVGLVQAENIRNITIRTVNFGRSKIADIDCDQFEGNFGHECDTFIFQSPEAIKKIVSSINKSQQTDNNNLDVRAKIYLNYYNGSRDSICMGPSPVFLYNGNFMQFNDDDFIDSVSNLLWHETPTFDDYKKN